jgi:hypothetical protein
MAPADQTILVTGATGLQGGACLPAAGPFGRWFGIHTARRPPNLPARALNSS